MRRRGFTLIEVLISIALVGMLLGSMFAFMLEMLSTRRRALDYTARQLAAATLIERLERDLATCLVGDRGHGAGIEGDATHLLVLSRSVAAHLAERGPGDPAVLGDLQQTEYRFNEQTGEIEARRTAHPAGPDVAPTVEAGFATLGPAFRLRFRYHDSNRWQDAFDSLAEDRLPTAVEVAVWFDPWPGEEPLARTAEPQRQRLTFDAGGGFDDAEAARRTDLDLSGEPRPDRFRVILIPDASTEDREPDREPPS